jgi:hypothetical protein
MAEKAKEPGHNNKEKIAFVICPIGDPESETRKRSDQILRHVIQPTVSNYGYKVIRADQIPEPGIITSQIITHLINDSLVIADLAGHNPNVFYELAVRHAVKKPVVQLIEKGERIPFDVSATRTIEIDHRDLDSADGARKELDKQIRAIEADPSKVDSPISIAVDIERLKESQDPQRKILAELRLLIQQTGASISDIKDMLVKSLPQSSDQSIQWLRNRAGAQIASDAYWTKQYAKRFDEVFSNLSRADMKSLVEAWTRSTQEKKPTEKAKE